MATIRRKSEAKDMRLREQKQELFDQITTLYKELLPYYNNHGVACNVSVPPSQIARIDLLVESGNALNRADFIRKAIHNELKEFFPPNSLFEIETTSLNTRK